MNSFRAKATIAILLLLAGIAPLKAQSYPVRPIKVFCAYAAGGGADLLVRYFAGQLEKLTGKPVVVENKVGAQGNIATHLLAGAEPDGYTLLITGTTAVVGNVFLLKDIKYDPLKDFAPAAVTSQSGYVLTVAPNSPVKTLEDLNKQLKAKNGAGRYGSSSGGNLVASELYLSMIGAKAERINYKSTTDTIPDMVSGDLDFAFFDTVFAIAQAKQGRLRMIAGSAGQHVPGAAGLPTMAEAGLPGYDFGVYSVAWFPKGTPEPIVRQMNEWINKIKALPETEKFLAENGAWSQPTTPEFMTKLVKSEVERWGSATAAAKIEKQ